MDSQRNHARLLEAAKAIFAQKGRDASLEQIARKAGVGIGTLYRHFPTRDSLIEAVYRNDLTRMIESASELAATRPPVAALREWMLLFVDYMATKRGMIEVLNSMAGGTADLYASSTAQTKQALDMLVDRGVASGEIHLDMEPLDLLRALAGVINISAQNDWRSSARSLVDILIAGIQTKSRSGA